MTDLIARIESAGCVMTEGTDMNQIEKVARAICRADPEVRMGDADGVVEQRVNIEWVHYVGAAKAAIAAMPVQAEPVAWMYERDGRRHTSILRVTSPRDAFAGWTETPLYAHPPTQWQGIEIAPRDGTVIDVWRDGHRETVYWGLPLHTCGEMGQYCDSDWHGIKGPGWVCSTFGEFLGGKHNPFTHWMPLPTPPNGGSDAE